MNETLANIRLNETLEYSSLMPPLHVISLGDVVLSALVITLGVFGVIGLVKALGFLLEGFSEHYDFKEHMLLFIAFMIILMYVKMG